MPRVDLQKYNKKVENPVAILWRLVCYFKHCRLLLTAAMLSILAYVAATIGAAYCMKPLTNLLEASGAAPNETYAKYISMIRGVPALRPAVFPAARAMSHRSKRQPHIKHFSP